MTTWGDRGSARGWAVLAGVAGAVLVAMVGAPLSVDLIFLVGPDHPTYIGQQFAVLFCGAVGTAAAVLLARHWRWLLVAGSVGMLAAQAIRVPRPQGLSIRVAGSDRGDPAPDVAAHTAWMCLLVAAAAVLLVAVLAVAQELLRSTPMGACVAGFAGCAAYFGVSVVGRLRGVDAPARVVVVAVAAAVTVLAVLRLRGSATASTHPAGSRVRLVAAAAALVWLLPTMIVAIRGSMVFGTVTGGIVGLVVLSAAIVASRPAGIPAMLAVAATGMVLATPVTVLVLLYDVLLRGVWYSWPIAIAGVLVGAATAAGPWPLRAGIVGAAGLSMIGLAANLTKANSPTGELIIWLMLALSMAAVATTVGSAAQVLAGVAAAPALSAPRNPCGTGDLWIAEPAARG